MRCLAVALAFVSAEERPFNFFAAAHGAKYYSEKQMEAIKKSEKLQIY